MNFLHNFIPKPMLFSIGPFEIHWYGLLMVVGGFLGLFFVWKLFTKYKIKEKELWDLVLYWVVFALLGARIYYVFYAWDYYRENLLDGFKVWEGGLAVHGVIIGGFLATYIFCRKHKLKFWLMADIAVVGLAFGQIIGRWGNYFNQEIFGQPTSLPWGIPIEFKHRPASFKDSDFFHPTVLYESVLNLVNFLILWLAHQWRLVRKKYLPEGIIFWGYVLIYSLIRFGLEFYRLDFSPLIFGVRWAQFFSVLLIVFSGMMIGYLYQRKR